MDRRTKGGLVSIERLEGSKWLWEGLQNNSRVIYRIKKDTR